MKKILKEPLLHFLLIGALLFSVFEMFGSSAEESGGTIRVSAGDIKMLQGNFSRSWQRPPSPQELDGLIKEKVREEIAYLEATSLGLDKEDPYIKRRLRMKMELLIDDLAASAPPSEEELQDYLERNREKFREDAGIAFSHVYLDVDRHGDTLEKDAAELITRLQAAGAEAILENFGDATMLPRTYPLTPAKVIDRQLGSGFSKAIVDMEPGTWLGPVKSGYGLHLVRVDTVVPGYDPPLSEIRAVVEREMMAERRREMLNTAYDRLTQKYTVIVEPLAESE